MDFKCQCRLACSIDLDLSKIRKLRNEVIHIHNPIQRVQAIVQYYKQHPELATNQIGEVPVCRIVMALAWDVSRSNWKRILQLLGKEKEKQTKKIKEIEMEKEPEIIMEQKEQETIMEKEENKEEEEERKATKEEEEWADNVWKTSYNPKHLNVRHVFYFVEQHKKNLPLLLQWLKKVKYPSTLQPGVQLMLALFCYMHRDRYRSTEKMETYAWKLSSKYLEEECYYHALYSALGLVEHVLQVYLNKDIHQQDIITILKLDSIVDPKHQIHIEINK